MMHRNNNLLDNGLKLHMPSIRTTNPHEHTLPLDRHDPDNAHRFTRESASKLPFRSAFSRFTCTTRCLAQRVSFIIASQYIIILCSTRVKIIHTNHPTVVFNVVGWTLLLYTLLVFQERISIPEGYVFRGCGFEHSCKRLNINKKMRFVYI
jgi:hypothetical protein